MKIKNILFIKQGHCYSPNKYFSSASFIVFCIYHVSLVTLLSLTALHLMLKNFPVISCFSFTSVHFLAVLFTFIKLPSFLMFIFVHIFYCRTSFAFVKFSTLQDLSWTKLISFIYKENLKNLMVKKKKNEKQQPNEIK